MAGLCQSRRLSQRRGGVLRARARGARCDRTRREKRQPQALLVLVPLARKRRRKSGNKFGCSYRYMWGALPATDRRSPNSRGPMRSRPPSSADSSSGVGCIGSDAAQPICGKATPRATARDQTDLSSVTQAVLLYARYAKTTSSSLSLLSWPWNFAKSARQLWLASASRGRRRRCFPAAVLERRRQPRPRRWAPWGGQALGGCLCGIWPPRRPRGGSTSGISQAAQLGRTVRTHNHRPPAQWHPKARQRRWPL